MISGPDPIGDLLGRTSKSQATDFGIDTDAIGILAASAMSALDLGIGLAERTEEALRLTV
jgi:hypothetical protein